MTEQRMPARQLLINISEANKPIVAASGCIRRTHQQPQMPSLSTSASLHHFIARDVFDLLHLAALQWRFGDLCRRSCTGHTTTSQPCGMVRPGDTPLPHCPTWSRLCQFIISLSRYWCFHWLSHVWRTGGTFLQGVSIPQNYISNKLGPVARPESTSLCSNLRCGSPRLISVDPEMRRRTRAHLRLRIENIIHAEMELELRIHPRYVEHGKYWRLSYTATSICSCGSQHF